ncbi:hypothetical protein PYCC9005_000526 [Savitreella phatthalungensis]
MAALTSQEKPLTDATLTVRIIKSFPHRAHKNLVLQHTDLTTLTVADLKQRCREEITRGTGAWKIYRATILPKLDTIKLYTKAHGTKTVNLIINLDDDQQLILTDDEKTLADYGCEHETELSFFNLEAYKTFQANPIELWE